jgi:hypothetical protein
VICQLAALWVGCPWIGKIYTSESAPIFDRLCCPLNVQDGFIPQGYFCHGDMTV